MAIITGEQVSSGDRGSGRGPVSPGARPAAFSPTLILSITAIAGCFLVLMGVILSIRHAPPGYLSMVYIRQNQTGKTALYLATFAVLLPLALVAIPRLADRIAVGPNAAALPAIAYGLAAALALALILVRVLPFSGRGLHSVLIAVGTWWVLAVGVLVAAARSGPLRILHAAGRYGGPLAALAALSVFGVVLCLTDLGSLSGLALALGGVAGLITVMAWGRVRVPPAPRLGGWVVDVAVVVLLLGAVTNVIVFHTSSAIPNGLTSPGVIVFQQDWILGPTNQLLHGGALLVGDPASQYGVGLVYFLAGIFHLAPIGYGTFGALDGILTSLVYACAYLGMRLAGVRRPLAIGALALAVTAFIYHLHYPVGALPELGPLRFGLPIAVLVALVAASARPRLSGPGQVVALVVVGVSSIWSIEQFAYTVFTYLAMVAMETFLAPAGTRRRWALRQLGWAAGACVVAHLILALATLAATGYLPDWSQYLVYVKGLLLGGKEGAVTYGFANWSPGLALGAACLASAVALVMLVIRAPTRARAHPRMMLALAGATAYAIAAFSYTDNRSSTYLFPYVALPMVMAGAIWLALLLSQTDVRPRHRRSGLAAAVSTAVIMLAAAWPTIGPHFSQSALARAYPNGGLSSALHRLWHPPPIDPRAPLVNRLLASYMPQQRVLIVLPDAPDLTIEALIRGNRALDLYLGDPAEDFWNPSVWVPRISRQIDSLPRGTRVLTDTFALHMALQLRGHPDDYALNHTLPNGNPELEWIIHRLDQRFRFSTVHRGPRHLLVISLTPRSGAA